MTDLCPKNRVRYTRNWQSSRFAVARIRTAHRHQNGKPPGDEQWVLCQWPDGESAPTKYWLSTLPPDTSVRTLVRFAKLRWRIERDYQELKQELGFDYSVPGGEVDNWVASKWVSESGRTGLG
jgi:SRSO17 transposase